MLIKEHEQLIISTVLIWSARRQDDRSKQQYCPVEQNLSVEMRWEILRRPIKLEKLVTGGQIRFILGKCKVMNMGRNNLSYQYILMDSELAVIF